MKKIFYIAFLICFLLSIVSQAQTRDTNYTDGQIYFKLKESVTYVVPDYNGGGELPPSPFSDLFIRFQATKTFRPFYTAGITGINLPRVYQVNFNKMDSAAAFIAALSAKADIQYAEKVAYHRLFATPNDPSFNLQWHLKKIDAENAWNITQGAASVVVAVVDNAVYTTHSDLAGKLVPGRDIADVDNDPNPPSATGMWSHGTHVAGIVGAATNNNNGIASIGWNVKIMPVKTASNPIGGDIPINPYDGIRWAANNGAKVISCSWGSYGYDIVYQNIIDSAYNKGIVVVAANGNDGKSIICYPAAYNHVIGVGATDPQDKVANFSNTGPGTDVMAPGVGIYSSIADNINAYDYKDGTSMATPLVSGICALMLSQNPSLTPDQVENCLKAGCENINALNPSYGGKIGAGRVNAYLALNCSRTFLAYFNTLSTQVCTSQSVVFNNLSKGNGLTYLWNFGDGNTSTLQNPSHTYASNGTYTVKLVIKDNLNNKDSIIRQAYIQVTPPTATLTSIETGTICRGTPVTIDLHFTGVSPYSITLNNGTTFPKILNADTNVTFIPGAATSSIGLSAMSDKYCTGTVSGTALYTLVDCCPNLLLNGNFEQGNTGFTSELSNYCNSQGPDNYCVYDLTPSHPWAFSAPPVPKKGIFSMGIDGSSGPKHIVGNNKYTKIWCQQLSQVAANTSYVANFYSMYGVAVADTPGVGRLRFQAMLNNQLLGPIQTPAAFTSISPHLWRQNTLNFNSGTISGSNVEFCICQVQNFDGNAYDYLLDDITLQEQSACCSGATALSPASFTGTKNYTNQTFNLNVPISMSTGSNVTFTNCTIIMGKNVKIDLLNGALLNLNNTYVRACGDMWDGIYINGSNPATRVFTSNNTIIEDAKNAIVSNYGGNFLLTGSKFNKNYKSIVVNAYTAIHPGVVHTCTFTSVCGLAAATYNPCGSGCAAGACANTKDYLRPPYNTQRSQTHIEATDVEGLNIGVTAASSKNYFSYANTGIKMVRSNVNVYQSDFSNFAAVPGLNPVAAVWANTGVYTKFTPFGSTAIKLVAKATIGGTAANASNTFNNCINGVLAEINYSVDVINNTFSNSVNDAVKVQNNTSNTPATPQSLTNISQNTINNAGNAGIEYYAAIKASHKVRSNTINLVGTPLGIGVLVQEVAAISNTNYNIAQNNITEVRYGIKATALFKAKIDTNTIRIRSTGWAQYGGGILLTNSNNCWIRSNKAYNLTNDPWMYWLDGIRLDLCYSDTVTCNLTTQTGTGMRFSGDQRPKTYFLNNVMDSHFWGLVIAGSGAIGQQGVTNGFSYENKWTGTYNTSDPAWAKVQTEGSTNGGLSPFYVNNADIAGSAYYPLASEIKKDAISLVVPFTNNALNRNYLCRGLAAAMAPAMLVESNTLLSDNNTAGTAYFGKNNIYTNAQKDANLMDLPKVKTFVKKMETAPMGKIAKVFNGIEQLDLASAVDINAGIKASNDIEQHVVEVNRIWLRKMQAKADDLTDAEIASLQKIAVLCPFTDGQGVYMARTLLYGAEADGKHKDYTSSCEYTAGKAVNKMDDGNSTNSEKNTSEKLISAKVYPNPASSSLFVDVLLNKGQSGTFELYTSLGIQVNTVKLNEGNNNLSLNLEALSSGLYTYRIIINDEMLKTDKISVIK